MMTRRLACVAGLIAVAILVSGCGVSLVGKHRHHVAEDEYAWQLGLVTVRSLNEGRSLIALYDNELPNDSGLTVLQLWGGRSKEE